MAQIQCNFSELTSTTGEISNLIAPRKLFMAVADCFGDKRTQNIAAVECSRSRHASRDAALRMFVCWSVEVWQRRRPKIPLKSRSTRAILGSKVIKSRISITSLTVTPHGRGPLQSFPLSISSGHIEVQTQQRDQHIQHGEHRKKCRSVCDMKECATRYGEVTVPEVSLPNSRTFSLSINQLSNPPPLERVHQVDGFS